MSELFLAIVERLAAIHGKPLDGVYVLTDGHRSATLNATTSSRDGVPAYSVRLAANGFPMGIVDAAGGALISNGVGPFSEDDWIQWATDGDMTPTAAELGL